ncbi:MAG: two-CW domain-containing protein [Thermodesulfobacteriota bacterium]
MNKQNCWEYFRCGREEGGENVHELGVCPAAVDTSAQGLNGGMNAGRICWAVAGTLCDGEVMGTRAEKERFCGACDFYRMVRAEEGFMHYVMYKPEQILD